MIPEVKIIEALLVTGVSAFIIINHSRIKRISYYKTLTLSFIFYMSKIYLGILEELFWEEFLNIFQHTFIAISSILLAIWCYLVFIHMREEIGNNRDN